MRRRKILASVLIACVVVGNVFNVFAADVTGSKTYDPGLVVDGSTTWNSAGGDQYVLTGDFDVKVKFTNDAFVRKDAATADDVTAGLATEIGEKIDRNWFNFVVELFGGADTKGMTLRADNWGWSYGDGTNVPTYVGSVSDNFWNDFKTFNEGRVNLQATKKDANTVEINITYDENAQAFLKYTITYPNGVPSEMKLQVGSDGGIVTLNAFINDTPIGDDETTKAAETETTKATETETTKATETETTKATETETTKATEAETTTVSDGTASKTGDVSTTMSVILFIGAAMVLVLGFKKDTVEE